jgi:hypothetical protein
LGLRAFSGVYESDFFGFLSIYLRGKELRIVAGPSGYPARLIHFDGDSFLFNATSPSDRLLYDLMTFDVGESGQVTGFNAGALGHFKKLHD